MIEGTYIVKERRRVGEGVKLGVPDPDLGVMRLVIIVGLVNGIIFGFLNSQRQRQRQQQQQQRHQQCPQQRTSRWCVILTKVGGYDRDEEGGYTGKETKTMVKSCVWCCDFFSLHTNTQIYKRSLWKGSHRMVSSVYSLFFGYTCSNMHWRSFHKSWYHNNVTHHSKPAIVSSKYQTYTQCLFVCSTNLSRKIRKAMNFQHRHRDKLTWASEGSRCHRLNTHCDPAPLCHLRCNSSTWHHYTNPFKHNKR